MKDLQGHNEGVKNYKEINAKTLTYEKGHIPREPKSSFGVKILEDETEYRNIQIITKKIELYINVHSNRIQDHFS